MNSQALVQLVISSGILGLIGWGIKRTIEGAQARWTERIEKAEQALIEERGKREGLAAEMNKRHDDLHEEIDDIRENKMDREEAMRENGRLRQTLEVLLTGQAEIKGELKAMNRISDSIVALARSGGN